MENRAKEAKEQKQKEKVESNEKSALNFYQKCVNGGKPVHDNGYPEIMKNIQICITKVLLEIIDASGATYSKRSEYLTMKKCEQWLDK